MNRKDSLLVLFVLLIAGVVYVLYGRWIPGNQVIITVDGKEYGTYALEESREILVETEHGYNQVVIADGMVYIQDADCPDSYCVKQGKTNHQNKSLICLPHKLVVEVRMKEKNISGEEVDAIAQ